MGRTDRATIRPIGSPHSGLMVPGRVGAVVSHKSWPLNPQGMRPTKVVYQNWMSITITTGHGHNGVPVQIDILRCSCSMLMFIFMSHVGFELLYGVFPYDGYSVPDRTGA